MKLKNIYKNNQMKKSFLVVSFLLLTISALFAQKNINNYKYVLVPKQFEFQNEEDSYQVNSLTKFLFERAGFTALFTDESYPEDLALDRCLALKVKIKTIPAFLSTRIVIQLLDCTNTAVFVTKEAKTKDKDFKKAYHGVIRKAFEDIEALNYKYEPLQKTIVKQEVEQIKESPKKVVKVVEAESKAIVEKAPKKEIEKAKEKPVKIKKEATAVLKKKELEVKNINVNLEGSYTFGNWGRSTITKDGDEYSVIGGDENFQFATIYKTSKSSIYIIKWAAFKQPQLLQVDAQGNLNVDSKNGTEVFKRVN